MIEANEQGTVKPGLLQKAGGGVLVACGVAGLVLPILPGWILIFAGLALMGEYRFYRWAKRHWEARVSRRSASKETP